MKGSQGHHESSCNSKIICELPVLSGTTDTENAIENKSRHVKHPTSWLETLVHLLRGNVGPGAFAMGEAFKHAGLLLGSVLTLLLAVACVHSQHILLKCARIVKQKSAPYSKPPDFAEIVEICFAAGPECTRRHCILARKTVNFFLCITQLGFCCVFFVFIANNMKQIADNYMEEEQWSVHIYMFFALPPILICSWIRNLKFLAPVSALANVLMGTGLIITFYFCCIDLPPIGERRAVGNWQELPLFFGIAIYCFEGIGLIMPLQNEMKHPKKFANPMGVLNIGMTLVTFLFTAIGFLSYLQYGEDVLGSVTLNLPADSKLAQTVKLVVSFALIFTYALQFYVPVDIMWPEIRRRVFPQDEDVLAAIKPTRALPEIIFRTLLVLVTFLVAELVPNLGLVISLVGAVSSTALALIFPPLSEMLLLMTMENTRSRVITLAKDIGLILLGLLGFVTGTYASLQGIIEAFASHSLSLEPMNGM